MNSYQEVELRFWRGEYALEGNRESWILHRMRDLRNYSEFVPEIHRETVNGLDLACGLISIFERHGTPANIWAVDALMDEYDRICPSDDKGGIHYQKMDGENLEFEDGFFDFVWCFNAIDHTPDPRRMADEIRRVLKPGGRLYFFVNFDNPPLSPAHYALWDRAMVDHCLGEFFLLRETTCWSVTWKKYIYVALYEKRA